MANLNEVFHTVETYPKYEISNYGSVRNVKTGRILKPNNKWDKAGRDRRQTVSFFNAEKGKNVTIRIHQLVIKAFGEEFKEGCTIDHIDRNPYNNHISNLRWATKMEQARNKTNKKKVRKISAEELDRYYQLTKTQTLATVAKEAGLHKITLGMFLSYMHPLY